MKHLSQLLWVAILALSLAGCANSDGSYDPLMPVKIGSDFNRYTDLHLITHSAEGVHMTAQDCDRLSNKILRKIHGRYKEAGNGATGPQVLFATVRVINYDEGNSFLRFLLAGLGQIHIDGEVTLTDDSKVDLANTQHTRPLLGEDSTDFKLK